MPIGSYEKRWFMKSQHMNPDDAVNAHMILDSSQSIGIHYGTFAEHPEHLLTLTIRIYLMPLRDMKSLHQSSGY
jgi:L-ascorbate metabolism protein UlaG (beta-lactamase superfamily)